jgi:alcohol dehydrogenase
MNLLNSFSFELPTRIEYGVGAATRLVDIIKENNAESILVVTDKGIGDSGLLERISNLLDAGNLAWKVFDNVEPNPKDYNVQEGAEMAKQLQPDCLLAIGGGSPIDCAKAIAVVARQGGAARDYEGPHKIGADVLPLIAIPTTAGTGSEVTFSRHDPDHASGFNGGNRNGCFDACRRGIYCQRLRAPGGFSGPLCDRNNKYLS